MTSPIASTAAQGAPQNAAAAAAKHKQMQQAAQGFEAVFLRQMIGSMRQAKLADDDLLDGGTAADQFRDMSDANLADSMAKNDHYGIAAMLLKQFEGKTAPAGAQAPAGTAGGAATDSIAASGKSE
jgi:flagellar protein FlgJ